MLKADLIVPQSGEKAIILLFGIDLIGAAIRALFQYLAGSITEQMFRYTLDNASTEKHTTLSKSVRAASENRFFAKSIAVWTNSQKEKRPASVVT